MKNKYWIAFGFALLFLLSSYGLCMAQNQTPSLTVKEIDFKAYKDGREKIAVQCMQTCVPALSRMEGKKPRIVMDLSDVSFIDSKYRYVPVAGKHIKRIRSYLDNDSKTLRITLDMDPLKHYVVRPKQDPKSNVYSLFISEKRRMKGKEISSDKEAGRISIMDKRSRPLDNDLKPPETTAKQAPVSLAVATEDKIALERGRSQMNAGNYAGAIELFSEMIAKNPNDRLSYRLRGNAYQNMGDRQKAIVDWITAARMGDEIVQSYLDYMQITWKETSKK